jgi:GNAT superfamily N-acetyltransferase
MSVSRLDHAAILARAFARDPLMAFVFPQPGPRQRWLAPVFRPALKACARFGGVACNKPRHSVAAWISMQHYPLRLTELMRSGGVAAARAIGWRAALRLRDHERRCEEALRNLRTQRAAFLWSVGVLPEQQGMGQGGRIIRHALESMRLRGHNACLLKTENVENVPLYEHFGFEAIDKMIVPTSGLPVWLMARAI